MLYGDRDKFGYQSASPVVEAYHASIRDMVRTAFARSGKTWQEFVFDDCEKIVTLDAMKGLEKTLVDLGYRFDWSAAISARERPEIYKPMVGVSDADMATFMFDHPQAPTPTTDTAGRTLCGIGDNVVCYPGNTIGRARYVRSPDQVLAYLNDGVPPDTIALIDDSGGTLTAPIIQQFKGVICAGGSTRSHLGILTREYGVPCLMNAKITGVHHGDLVELETSAPAKTAAAYQSGAEMTANIWRLPAE